MRVTKGTSSYQFMKQCEFSLEHGVGSVYFPCKLANPSAVCTPLVPVSDLSNADVERLWYSLSPVGRQALVARVVPVA